jgi:hypothetical protein
VGDFFQVIADVEAAADEAPGLAASAVSWLAGEGIIMAEPCDCVLAPEPGYPPGPRYVTAVTHPGDRVLRLRTNGVEVCAGRNVFHPVAGEFGPVVCPCCRQTLVLQDPVTGGLTGQWEPFAEALTGWAAGGAADVTCPQCGQVSGLNDWDWVGDWPLAVGYLGFRFWNWPELSESFIAGMAAHLGHRVVVTSGKI